VKARDRAGRVLALPSQLPGTPQRFGISRQDLDRAAWTVDRRGRKLGGAAAVTRTLEALGGPWRLLAALLRLPGGRWLAERAYVWVASHRGQFRWLAVTPACDRPGVNCA
jgi:predicted DCC family thiol-disulfide oxidoreductase YuxK